jgi:hypothetical protein
VKFDGNVTIIRCETSEEKQEMQYAMSHQVKVVPLYENNNVAGTPPQELYVYYDLATGHMFVLQYVKQP